MPIDEKEVQERVHHVGASDVHRIITGERIYDLWLEKTEQVKPVFAGTEATEIGLMVEVPLLKYAEEQYGPFVTTLDMTKSPPVAFYDVKYRHPSLPMLAHWDAEMEKTGEPWEAKTKGMASPGRYEDNPAEVWGEPYTAIVPDRVTLQLHAQMMCPPPPKHPEMGHVIAMIAGRGRLFYHVPRRHEIEEGIGEAVDHFWYKHVVPVIPPEDSAPSWDYARLLPRNIGEVRHLSPDEACRIREYRDVTQTLGVLDKRREALREQLVGISGGAEFLAAENTDGAIRIYKKPMPAEKKIRAAYVQTVVQWVPRIK